MSARNRLYRERLRAGRRCFEIEADETGLIDALQRNGFLLGKGATQVSDCLSAQAELAHQAALILRPEKHVHDPIRMLRALLKIAGRQLGLKAVQIREQTMDDVAA
jgi:hypothetical protein